MKLISAMIVGVLLSPIAFAADLVKEKDWKGEKKLIEQLGQPGCVASTKVVKGDETFTLNVITLETSSGQFTQPLVMADYSAPIIPDFFEARAATDRTNTIYNMTLLQLAGSDNMVASRLTDSAAMVTRLQADNKFTVGFKDKENIVREIVFSLRGSSKVISTVLAACR